MTPSILTTFIINTLKANIKDIYVYSVYAFGNITAKFGSTTFYQNTNFDEDADIVIVPNTAYTDNKDIDLPLDQDGNIKSGSYEITYTVKVEAEVKVYPEEGTNTVITPGSDTFTSLTLDPAVTGLADTLQALIDEYGSLQVKFYDLDGNVVAGVARDVVPVDDETINFDEVTVAGYTEIESIAFFVPETYEKTWIYTFCDETPVSDLCVTHNCYTSQLSVIDNTVYPATQTVNSRLLTIQYPRLANGTPVATTVTSESVSKTIGPNIWSGNYTVTNEVEIEWTGDDGLVNTNTITTQVEHEVSCDASLCDLFNCINALRVAYQSALQNGSRQLAQFQAMNFQVLLFVQSYTLAVQCQNTAKADQIINDLQLYLGDNSIAIPNSGCGCGCGDSGSSSNGVPAIIYPLYSDTSGDGGEYVPVTRTVNGHALSSDVTVTKTDVGLGNVPNEDATNPVNIDQTSSYRFVTDTEKATWNAKQAALTAATFGTFVDSLSSKATPVDADTIPLKDSADSNNAKEVTWTNIKATLETYFDTVYQGILPYVAEDAANKSTNVNTDQASNIKYPSVKAVFDWASGLFYPDSNPDSFIDAAGAVSAVVTQAITNGVTGHSPSEDVVYDALLTKEGKLTGQRFTSGPVVEALGTTIYRINTALGAVIFTALLQNTTARILTIINEDGTNTITIGATGFTFNGGGTFVVPATPLETVQVFFDGTGQTDIIVKTL